MEWIKKIARGILWVTWIASFVYSIDYSKLKTSRPDTSFLYHIMKSFYTLKVEYMDDRPGERSPE